MTFKPFIKNDVVLLTIILNGEGGYFVIMNCL